MTDHLALDHLVYGVPDLMIAVDDFEKRLGLAPVFGGHHEGLGTHNAILQLEGETYLELIASNPDGPRPKQARPFGLDTLHIPRLIAWAVRSRKIEADVERARVRGFDPGMVFPMTRKEPDGRTLQWKLTLRQKPFGDGLVPFVIDWGNTRHPSAEGSRLADTEVIPEITTAVSDIEGSIEEKLRPGCRLAAFSATHPDPESVRAALDALGARLDIQRGASSSLNARLTGPTGFLELGRTN